MAYRRRNAKNSGSFGAKSSRWSWSERSWEKPRPDQRFASVPGPGVDYTSEAYGFVKANRAVYRVATMCRVLEVSRSGYYAWLKREPSARDKANAALLKVIKDIHKESGKTYGAPRIHAELEDRGPQASLNRVARVMREAEIRGVSPRKWTTTTLRGKRDRPAPDLVDRDFTATGPDQLWVADITYIPTWAGFLFLAIVLDVWSRRVVGWAMATHMRTELVLDALDMALARRKPRGVIHHSDQGCQYTFLAFGRRCELMGVLPSMGSVGDAYDNAMAESFFGTLECELLDRYTYRTPTEARQAVFRYIEGWYNPRRRHSSLGYLSPAKFEAKHGTRSERSPGLADSPAVGEVPSARLGSTPLQAAEALLTPGREEEEVRLNQPQYSPVH